MAKKKSKKEDYLTEDILESAQHTAEGAEKFFEKNAKWFAIFFGLIIAGAIGYFLYLKYVVEPKNAEAMEHYIEAQNYLQQDSLDLALNGTPETVGFAELTEEYGSTAYGKASHLHAGRIAYSQGKYEEALEHFKNFESGDDIANAIKYGAMADTYVQLGNTDEAFVNFDKAIKTSDNEGAKVFYMIKAGILAKELKQKDKALEYFKKIQSDYPDVDPSGQAEMYLSELEQAQ